MTGYDTAGPARSLLLIGAGTMGRGYIAAAERNGFRILVVETLTAIESLRADYPGVVIDAEPVPPELYDDDSSWLDPAMRLAVRNRVEGVLAFTEPHVVAAAYVQQVLRLPGPSLFAAVASRDKALQRSLLDAAGVPQPTWHLARGRISTAAGGPWVVKPLDSMGSEGVILVATDADLEAVLARPNNALVLVEEYVDGQEFSWEALVQGGSVVFTNVTRKHTGGYSDFVELGHVVGQEAASAEEEAAIEDLGAATVAALGVQDSIVHMEAKIDSTGRAVVIETAVRAPGDFIFRLVFLATGVDMYEMCARLALGEPLRIDRTNTAAAAIRFVGAEVSGILTAADLEPARRVAGVEEVALRAQLGTVVRPPRASWERLAYVITTARTAPQAAESSRTAAAALTLNIHQDR